MQTLFDELTASFRRNSGRLSVEAYDRIVSKHCSLFEDSDTVFMLLQATGAPKRQGSRSRSSTGPAITPDFI